jgi:predicted Zn-ribbon and HTH transcriptional regulator
MANSNNISLNDIFRLYGDEYRKKHPFLSTHEKKVMRAIEMCRTEFLGGRIEKCNSCGYIQILYNSCRNRHCPQCQFMKKEKWILKRKQEVLPFQYFHVVFTLPHQLNPLVERNKRIIYDLLFNSVNRTLVSVAEKPEYFGAKIGFFSILHTWGQKLNLHPHLHCVVPGGGRRIKDGKWIKCKQNFFIHTKVLMPWFRRIFLTGLKKMYKQKGLYLTGTEFSEKNKFQSLIDELFKTDWICYIKESFKNENSIIEYLSRYTHRIAISNYRIRKLENDRVYFAYKDYKEENKKKTLDLDVMDFIRRFMKHILPPYYMRIRYFGLLSHRTRKTNVERCRDYYQIKWTEEDKEYTWKEIFLLVMDEDVSRCPSCKEGTLELLREIGARSTRAPPKHVA